jgi:hypothetical protein
VPKKTHEQHELFIHIGIWRSAVIGKAIVLAGLDACQLKAILNFSPAWDDWPPRASFFISKRN